MSRRRGGNDNPLSLFAFQDVITGVTGIMILVVLLLVLEVISQKSADTPKTSESEESAENVEEQIAALEKEKNALIHNIDRIQGDIQRLGGTDPRELQAAIKREKERALELADDIKATGDYIKKEQTRRGAPEAEVDKLAKRNRELRGIFDTLAKELRIMQEEGERVQFSSNRPHVLAQCSGKGIRVKAWDGDREVQFMFPPGSTDPTSALAKFSQWIRTRQNDRERFIVALKPSAASYAADVIDLIRQAGFSLGHEPLEEDKTAIFGEGGDSP